MQGQWMLLTATILAIASPGLSEVIVDGYAFDDGKTSESILEAKAQMDAINNAVAYVEGVEFTLTLSDGHSFQATSKGALSGLTTVEKGFLGNGLYRVRMRIPDSVPLRDKELRDALEPTFGSSISQSSDLAFARRKALSRALSGAIPKAAEDWYGGRVPSELTGRYYDLQVIEEEIVSDSDPFSYRVEIEVKVWFSDPRVTAVSGSWGQMKSMMLR